MSNVYKGEFQDHEGNVVYPHSQADVVFCTDGETVQSKLNKTENVIGGVTGRTDSLEVDDSNILATSKAVHTLNNSLTEYLADGKVKFQVTEDGKLQYSVYTEEV